MRITIYAFNTLPQMIFWDSSSAKIGEVIGKIYGLVKFSEALTWQFLASLSLKYFMSRGRKWNIFDENGLGRSLKIDFSRWQILRGAILGCIGTSLRHDVARVVMYTELVKNRKLTWPINSR